MMLTAANTVPTCNAVISDTRMPESVRPPLRGVCYCEVLHRVGRFRQLLTVIVPVMFGLLHHLVGVPSLSLSRSFAGSASLAFQRSSKSDGIYTSPTMQKRCRKATLRGNSGAS